MSSTRTAGEETVRERQPGEAAHGYEHQLPVLVPQPAPQRLRAVRPAAPSGPVNRRMGGRKPVKLSGQIYLGPNRWLACTVYDMSATGALLEHTACDRGRGSSDPMPDRFFLVIESLLERSEVECLVKWRKDDRAGVKFMGPIDVTVRKLPTRPVRKAATIKRR